MLVYILYSNNVINYLNNMFQGIVVNNADYDELNTELDDVIRLSDDYNRKTGD